MPNRVEDHGMRAYNFVVAERPATQERVRRQHAEGRKQNPSKLSPRKRAVKLSSYDRKTLTAMRKAIR